MNLNSHIYSDGSVYLIARSNRKSELLREVLEEIEVMRTSLPKKTALPIGVGRTLRPLTWPDIKPDDKLITVAVDMYNKMYIGDAGYFVITRAPRMKGNIGHIVDVIGSQLPGSSRGYEFMSTLGIPIDGKCDNDWRTFRWTPEIEEYLRDLVARQAFAEYLEIISRPRVVVDETITSSATGTSGTATAHRPSGTSGLALIRKMIGRKRDAHHAIDKMAARNNAARLAREAELARTAAQEVTPPN